MQSQRRKLTLATAGGVTPQGNVTIGRDAGRTWRASGTVQSLPQALAATRHDPELEILVVTEGRALTSADGSRFTDATSRL